MDVLVLLDEECDEAVLGRPRPAGRAAGARPLAYVNSVPDAARSGLFAGRAPGREVVTLCGEADADALAVALAAVVEGRRTAAERSAVRHLGVWAGGGASGDAAWRDRATGQLVSHDLDIAAATLDATARRLLAECGAVIRQTAAKLAMPDWPEGVRRALSFTLDQPDDGAPPALAVVGGGDGLLASLREADGYDDDA